MNGGFGVSIGGFRILRVSLNKEPYLGFAWPRGERKKWGPKHIRTQNGEQMLVILRFSSRGRIRIRIRKKITQRTNPRYDKIRINTCATKKNLLLSMTYWLVNTDPYNGSLKSL